MLTVEQQRKQQPLSQSEPGSDSLLHAKSPASSAFPDTGTEQLVEREFVARSRAQVIREVRDVFEIAPTENEFDVDVTGAGAGPLALIFQGISSLSPPPPSFSRFRTLCECTQAHRIFTVYSYIQYVYNDSAIE